jgi:hypothetical protein
MTRSGVRRPEERWVWFLVLFLLLTLGVHVWPEHVPWRAQTLHRDLPWTGLGLVVIALVLGASPVRRAGVAASWPAGRRRWVALAGVAGGLAGLVALPTGLAVSRAGLSVATGPVWGVTGAVAEPRPARRLDFGGGSGGPWGREAFFASVSGWLYIPVAGTHEIAVYTDADAIVQVDGRAIVGQGAPPGFEPPGVTDARTRFRRAPADLRAGFHAIRVLSRHEAGSARLRLRWTAPWLSRAVSIPAEHLLPADATPLEIRLRRLALAGRRVGAVGLACLGLAGLAVILAALRERVVPGAPARVDRTGHAALGLLFFALTGAPLLTWPEQQRILAPLLLGTCVAGTVAVGMLRRLSARWRGPAAAGRWREATDRLRRVWPAVTLVAVQAMLAVRFLSFVDGRLPFPGDHSSFLYRYHALLHTLPRLRGYDPWWNAGAADPSWALSGSTAILALFWPLLAVWRLPDVYASFVLLVGAVVAPWSLFWTVRLLGGSRLAALLAGILTLAPGDVYFWWLMAHGTLPSIVSTALAPLAIALAWRVFVRHDPRPILILALALVLAVGLFWVGFVWMTGPALLIGAVVCRRHLRWRDLARGAVVAAGVILIHAHWLAGVLGSPQVGYMTPKGTDRLSWGKFVNDSLEPILVDPNPIALVLGAVGTFLLPGPLRLVYGGFVLSLLATATLLQPIFWRLELDRFFVPFGIALIPPAAWLAARLLRAVRRGVSPKLSVLAGLGLVGMLWLHVDGVWRQYGGQIRRTARQIDFQSDPTRELIDWIRASPPDGRILLWGALPGPGRLEGGYKAYLQPLTGRPLIGLHVNVKWVDLAAGALLRGPDIRGTLEAFNVRHVVIRDDDPRVRSRLDLAPGLRLRKTLSAFLIYDVDIRPTYLLGAEGTVAFDYDRLDVRLERPVDAVTLKFRWQQGLVSDPPLPLEPVEILPGVQFIRVRAGGTRAFRIRYVDCCPWHPVEWWVRWRSA